MRTKDVEGHRRTSKDIEGPEERKEKPEVKGKSIVAHGGLTGGDGAERVIKNNKGGRVSGHNG